MTRPAPGAYYRPSIDPDWLGQHHEAALEPDLPIIDSHHHLWDRPEIRYLAPELMADFGGHNVRATVFIESLSMYRAEGPEWLRPVGEVEFANGVAAMSASGAYGLMQLTPATAARVAATAAFSASRVEGGRGMITGFSSRPARSRSR